MADNTINVKIKQRIDAADNWSSKNPVLLAGEVGYIKGTAQYKQGDGSTAWNSLPLYQGMTSADRTKLDGIASGANKYTHPTTSGNKHIPSGGSSGQILRWSADGTAVWGADNNTWRPVETTLTNENLNNITSPGFYNAGGGNTVTNKPSGVEHFGMIVVHRASGSYYTQILFNDAQSWRRFCVNGTWGSWTEEKLTDTVYTHPSYTAKSSGLYKVTVDATGHISATTAVSKADITNLGIPSTNTTYSTGTASTAGLTKLYTGIGTATDGTMTQAAIKSALDGKSESEHTHNYAGSSSAGGSATSAVKLDTATAGSATQPVYFSGGKPVATTYTLGKSVPSNAVFTDTNNKVTQTAVTDSDYTNWRSLVWGASNSGTEGFSPTTVTDGLFSSTSLSVQPSTGTIRATTFKGSLSGNATSASKVNGHSVNSDVPSGAVFTDTNTKVTSVGNHYTPNGGTTTSASGGTLTDITNSSSGVQVVTGVTKDAAGHVTGVTSVALKSVNTNTTYSNFVKSGSGAKAGLVPAPSTTAGTTKYLREDGTWTTPPNTNTWTALKGATTDAAGTAGYAPAPAAGAANRYLRSDGTWQVPPDNDTTYSNMTAATASAAGKAGLVPAPAAGKQASFLRGDGTWVVPTNTTYSDATTSAHGLMTAAMVTKLNGIATNANNYSLPTASSTLGGVKTTSTVTSNSGYTACPIISGVVYYKDTNTTYGAATASANGLMTSTAYSALDTELTEADVNAIFA